MAQINSCLKRTFIFFNFLFAIVGGVIVASALLFEVLYNSHEFEGRWLILVCSITVGSITMLIAILGAYGAHRESKASLVVFLICMVIGSIAMLRLGVDQAIAHPNMEEDLNVKLHAALPLDEAPEEVKGVYESLQSLFHCCGLFSYKDWQGHIPDSCICDPQEFEGNCRTVDYMSFFQQEVKSVYAQTCFPILWHYVSLYMEFITGLAFFLASLALLGMILSGLMIHQMRPVAKKMMVMTIPTIFSAQPPKYEELYNSPDH